MLTKPHERLQPGHGPSVSGSEYTHLKLPPIFCSYPLRPASLQNERGDTVNASASNAGRERGFRTVFLQMGRTAHTRRPSLPVA